jgi:hypothetical protein
MQKMNEILVESQKMIYAPPSREKSKQTMRSPMIDKAILNVSQVNNNAPIAGSVTGFGVPSGGNGNDEYNLMQASIYSGGGAMPPPHSSGNGSGAGGGGVSSI